MIRSILCALFYVSYALADLDPNCYSLSDTAGNPNLKPSMLNSVDFHPTDQLLCVSFTHNDKIILYEISNEGKLQLFQIVQGSESKLRCPQHACFTKDGNYLIVANWGSQTFTIYPRNPSGFFDCIPIRNIGYSKQLDKSEYRPHGMTFSCTGDFLAVAHGAACDVPRAVALYHFQLPNLQLMSLISGNEIEEGIPKGITFSPDQSCLLITFARTNSIGIYPIDWDQLSIASRPAQIIQCADHSRPEDIKFTKDGQYCAVTNSGNGSVVFYKYDKGNNLILDSCPAVPLEASFTVPHNVAFSPEGLYLAVTDFGDVVFGNEDHLLSWAKMDKEKVFLFKKK